MEKQDKTPLIGLTLEDLQRVALDNGLPKFAGGQMAQWLYQKQVKSIDEMTNLSKAAREKLNQHYCVGLEAPLAKAESTDGTVKYLFRGVGGHNIESVYIPDKERATLCISSQAGCKMGCTFCMTGKQGWHGNLSTTQILNQIMSVDHSQELTNIVFMGMGEPLDNLSPVLKAIDILTAKWGFAWSPKRITVSTIGKITQLRELIENTKVHIAISVHSPFSEQREGLMPVERAYPIREVMNLLRQYDFAHQRRLSVEYIVWRGINDTMHYADSLAKLLQGTSARVNLIRFHSIPGVDLKPASEEQMIALRDRLNHLGVTATIRASRGEDIAAACGMLAGTKNKA